MSEAVASPMDGWMAAVAILAGIVMLYFGSQWMVDGAKGIAFRLGVTPFVVGLTVVAFGSSAPEAITSVVSTSTPEIILGNVIGSNIANIGLAIGLAAVLSPIVCSFSDVRFDLAAMIVVSAVVMAMAAFGVITFPMGAVLVAGLLVFLVLTFRFKKRDASASPAPSAEPAGTPKRPLPVHVAMVVVGIVVLYFGARFFIDGAVAVAEMIGVSDLMIGLILVAVGTSLPELCICLVAAYRKENDIAVSNILGSNIFNGLFVLGIGALLVDIPVAHYAMVFHLPVMLAFAVIMAIMIWRGNGIGRRNGAILAAMYVAYIAAMAIWPVLTSGVV